MAVACLNEESTPRRTASLGLLPNVIAFIATIGSLVLLLLGIRAAAAYVIVEHLGQTEECEVGSKYGHRDSLIGQYIAKS